eukprot:10752-Chlamydomonas_euryale.AAC.1
MSSSHEDVHTAYTFAAGTTPSIPPVVSDSSPLSPSPSGDTPAGPLPPPSSVATTAVASRDNRRAGPSMSSPTHASP